MRRAGIGVLAALTGLTAGCQMFGSDESTDAEDADLALVRSVLDENRRLIGEIVDVQERLILDCVEQRGHTVHDEYESVMWHFQKHAIPDQENGALGGLLNRDIAEDWGFGVWTGGDGMAVTEEQREFEKLVFGDSVKTFSTVDNAAFEALSDKERFDWYTAYYGEERALADHGHLTDQTGGGTGGPGGLIGTVEPGGCMGEVTEALGLEPEFVPQPDFGDEVGTWSTFPLPPGQAALGSAEFDEEMRRERTREGDFLDCLDDKGWGRWEFNASGDLNVRHFIELAYGSPAAASDSGPAELTEGVPEPPSDVPADAEERRTWEIGFALDVWDCVDETGFDEDADRAWAATYGQHFLDLEEEAYAWQDDMRSLLELAQGLL